MNTITNTQIKRGVGIAQQEGDLRWAWGDLAFEVAPPSENQTNNGQTALLNELRKQIAEHVDINMHSLPTANLLRQYRDAAAAIPFEARDGISVYAARQLGIYESNKAKRLAVIEQLRTEHPKGRVTVEAVQAYFGKAPNNTPGKRKQRVENDLNRSPHDERVRHAQRLMNDPAVEHEVRKRPAREKNWNGKTGSMREREIKEQSKQNGKPGKPDNYNELLRLSLQLNRACSVIKAYKIDELNLDGPALVLVDDFHSDLITLDVWINRALMATQSRLSEVKVREKIVALRLKTVANGATSQEETAAYKVADDLERKFEALLPA